MIALDKINNIASTIDIMAEKYPYKTAIIFPEGRDKSGRVSYTHYTFGQLSKESNIIAKGLNHIGIKKGTRTVLMVKPSLEFFALTFALFKAGVVPVMIDPGIGIDNLKECIGEAEPEAFIGIPKAHVARKMFKWGKNTIKTCVTVGKKMLWEGYTLEDVKKFGKDSNEELVQTSRDDMAAILFTSGSTGIPKGVVYKHKNFIAQVEILKEIYKVEENEIDLPTFPLFALFNPALGMISVIPDMDATKPADVDPTKIIEAIENFGITNMFGSPALLNRVSKYCVDNKVKLPSLKRLASAGAPVPAQVIERFLSVLSPETEIMTPYGATESLPISIIGSKEILSETKKMTDEGKGVCVGKIVNDTEVKIIKISDEPIKNWSDDLVIKDGEIGEIVIKGEQVTEIYYNRIKATELAKIRDGDSIRHRMGDLGYFDQQGRLWFCGRKAHRVVSEKKTHFTVPIENIFNTHKMVYRTALVGIKINDSTQPLLCVELEEESDILEQKRIKSELLEIGSKFEITRDIKKVLFKDKFPVDIRHNSKIFREKLSNWAQEVYN